MTWNSRAGLVILMRTGQRKKKKKTRRSGSALWYSPTGWLAQLLVVRPEHPRAVPKPSEAYEPLSLVEMRGARPERLT